MDPWQPCPDNTTTTTDYTTSSNITNEVGLALHNEQEDQNPSPAALPTAFTNSRDEPQDGLAFGDNFQPFVKLPDSQEYLESLEKKLKKIQKGGASADSILRSLGQTKESCMIKLLSNSVEKLTVDGEIFEELRVNPLLKKLAPERQALTAEELVHLLKADQLDILLGSINLDEELLATPTATAETSNQPGTSDPEINTPGASSDTNESDDTTTKTENES